MREPPLPKPAEDVAPPHEPVLLEETLQMLAPSAGEVCIDCTAGGGGHACAIASQLGPTGTLALLDVDPAALAVAEERVRKVCAAPAVLSRRINFAQVQQVAEEEGLVADMLLADVGFSSMQMDDPARGFSMKRNGPLDMRLDPEALVTARDIVNTASEQELAAIFRDYGEEPAARIVARKLVAARRDKPMETTEELAELVRSAVRRRRAGTRIDPATRVFQALRIAVNDELGALEALLGSVERAAFEAARGGASWLAPGARVGVIAFHSLEDRLVKRAFERIARSGAATTLTRKPVRPSPEEQARNRRCRSARLRVIRVAKGP